MKCNYKNVLPVHGNKDRALCCIFSLLLFCAGCGTDASDDHDASAADADGDVIKDSGAGDSSSDIDTDTDTDSDTDTDTDTDTDADSDSDADADADAGRDSGTDSGFEQKSYTYNVINTYPHDPDAFTQGLVYIDGGFYEGTGLKGSSSLRKVDLETGTVEDIHNLNSDYFGEGIAVWQDSIIQLTWQDNVAFVYNADTLDPTGITYSYTTEGWGLTHDGDRLIMSDGTATLYFRDPDTFGLLGTVDVHAESGPVTRLNELEYINGRVFANVWQTNIIVIINPDNGRVTGIINLAGILAPGVCAGSVDVLNGIAWDDYNDRLYVTGKLWCRLFEIELIEQ